MSRPRPTLSICIGTAAGWPAIEPCVRSFLDDAQEVGAEVLIADGSGRPAPDDPSVLEGVTWNTYAEASVFRLVGENIGAASGGHRRPDGRPLHGPTGLGRRRSCGHTTSTRRPPRSVAAIENGTPGGPLEWASYLMTQGAHMAPLQNGPTTRIANEADISFKRWALEDVEDHPLGFMTIRHSRSLADRANSSSTTTASGRPLRIARARARRWSSTSTTDGRSPASVGGRWLRGTGSGSSRHPFCPLYRGARVVRNAVSKGRSATVLTALPWLIVLEYCHGVGEFAGYVLGPGRSPYGLR